MIKLVALSCAFAAPVALAHNLWLEPDAGGLHARYGEPEIRVLEGSPGKLDELSLTRAETVRGADAAPAATRKNAGSFVLQGAGHASAALVEARATAVRSGAGGNTQALYYARRAPWPLKPMAPAMALDIVPTAEPNTFAVSFNGAPLTQGTLKVIAPSLWIQVHDIDPQGRVRIHTPWRGLYVLDVSTREQRAGELAGQRYDSVAHRVTLSFTKPDGPAFPNPLPAQYKPD